MESTKEEAEKADLSSALSNPEHEEKKPFVRLSKKEKRLLKVQKFKDTKKERKQASKQRRKDSKQNKNLDGEHLTPVHQQPQKRHKKRKLEDIPWSNYQVVIDLGFDSQMTLPVFYLFSHTHLEGNNFS